MRDGRKNVSGRLRFEIPFLADLIEFGVKR
jgi:hypothetical protein